MIGIYEDIYLLKRVEENSSNLKKKLIDKIERVISELHDEFMLPSYDYDVEVLVHNKYPYISIIFNRKVIFSKEFINELSLKLGSSDLYISDNGIVLIYKIRM